MMLQALVLAVAQALSPAATAFVEDATARLIAGEELSPDFPVRLQALPPDQRLLAIVHLRRAGYLADVVMPLDWILSPAGPDPATDSDAALGSDNAKAHE
ncbi:hypothetical protein SAMN04488075_2001 [Paracoccus alkenifer]|uniref:Uncharacterized protein n=2 Tax=Paracoccus alkenifer TaxID=65735 RepID=A0A1H6MIG1_9RHOB|nr:hypothetical protein SAMN04488075_2001 [Paracoccus alkenifer]